MIETEEVKLAEAENRAKAPGAGVKEAMEYFFAKNNLSWLKNRRSYPKVPARESDLNNGLFISGRDDDGYAQWKPVPLTSPVDFAEIEKELGFEIHQSIKDFYSAYSFMDLDGIENNNDEIWFDKILPEMDISQAIKSGFAIGDEHFLNDDRYFSIGGTGTPETVLVNNRTGEVTAAIMYEDWTRHVADSLYDLLMSMEGIWG